MTDLQELVFLLADKGIERADTIVSPSFKNTNYEKLYKIILSRKTFDENKIAKEFYKESKNPEVSYRKLKNRLKEKLLNSIFFLDLDSPSSSERKKAYYKCYKDWAATKILLGENATLTAISLSKKLLSQALKYEFTELVIDISKGLRSFYIIKQGDLEKFKYYSKLFHKHKEICDLEDLVEDYYLNLVGNKKILAENLFIDLYGQTQKDPNVFNSYRLNLYRLLISLQIYSSFENYDKLIKTCNDAVHFFESKPYNANVPLQICYHQMQVCYIQLKQYSEGKKIGDKNQALLENGSFSWFKQQELNLILAMHAGHYQIAYEVFFETVNHVRFSTLSNLFKEMWTLFHAYLYLMFNLKKIEPYPEDTHLSKFKVYKFLNSTPAFAKDKGGMNISVIIVRIIFYIFTRDFANLIDNIDALEKYSLRYLRKDSVNERSYYFIKMLLAVQKANFSLERVSRNTDKWWWKLNSSQPKADQLYIEIIPYETLWDYITTMLSKKT